MPDPAVIFTYVATLGAILGYAAWMESRRRKLNRPR